MCVIILNYRPSSASLKHPLSQLMPLGNVERIHASMKPLAHVQGELVSFERVREKTFTKVPAIIPTNASLISKHWNLSGSESSEDVILYQHNVQGGGCKLRYKDDPQGCVTCFHDHKCPTGWSYHTYKHCGFLHWGCHSICKQEYDCPTDSPTTSPTTLAPTTSPTWSPTGAPTFAPFTIPKEIKRTTPFVGFTGEFYLINERTGQVVEQAIADSHPRPGRFQCSDLIDDGQGCVTCLHDNKCPTGSTYKKYEHCGFLWMGCKSKCAKHYDCDEPYELLYMNWIQSSKDNEKNTIPNHPQLWHFNEEHNQIITSANDWVIQIRGEEVVAAPATSGSAYVLSYDVVSQNIRIGENNQFLCSGFDEKLKLCEDPGPAESRWIIKTPEEAFSREYGNMGKYYIASKESDLIVEQTYTQEGYPLTTWIPDGSSGQLWYSDSHGRIRNDGGYYIESADSVAIKYIIPDVPVGTNFAVSSPNHPDFELQMTPELWHFRGTTNYLISDISPDKIAVMSTTTTPDQELVGGQQWDLKNGQLVNGLGQRKLAIDDLNGSHIGVECSLENKTSAGFYLVPEAMIVSWIDLVALKKFDMSYVREEAFFYQKVAAFHIDTIIGLSPEELVARAHIYQELITSGVDALRKHNKDKSVGSIATSGVGILGGIVNIIGFLAIPATFGGSAALLAVGATISGSAELASAIHDAKVSGKIEVAERAVEMLFYEIQGSVLSGANALGSFLTDYLAAMRRLMAYNQTPEGQQELQEMEEWAVALAHDVGYERWEVMYREIFTPGTQAFELALKLGDLAETGTGLGMTLRTLYVLATATKLSDKLEELFPAFNYFNAGYSPGLDVVMEVAWIILAVGNIVLESMKLHQNDMIGAEMLKGVDAIRNETSNMYSLLNALNGDVEDLRDLDAQLPASKMFFTNDELNDKWRTLTDMGNGELDNPVYGKLTDVNWYPGCDNIPCSRLD